jgi:hypothetical protein
MTNSRKIVIAWIVLAAAYAGCLWAFPHNPVPLATWVNRAFMFSLFLIAILIFRNEKNANGRAIFANFVVYFAFLVTPCIHEFVGTAFLVNEKYAAFLSYQTQIMLLVLAAGVAVVYLAVDVVFHPLRVLHKYLVTAAVVAVFFMVYFHPFVSDPFHLYKTEDIKQWKTLDDAVYQLGYIPSETELASRITLQSWADGKPIGTLYPEENLKRISDLSPYLYGDNWPALFWKPLYTQVIKMHVLLIICLLFAFGYQYTKDPPQGAYIDKIMFLLLLSSSLEILHNWGFIKNVEWGVVSDLFSVGQYVILIVDAAMVLFFALRLKFITSVQGGYYEAELDANPSAVTRWRDWVDNLVLAHFFDYKLFNGRLFQKTSAR